MRDNINFGLAPLATCSRFQYGVWDIEATNWWNLEMIGAYDGTNYYHFREIGSFIDYLLSDRYRSFRWFAHFGGRYDLNFIFDWIRTRSDIEVSFYCSGAMVLQMTLRRRGILVKLCDSYRLLQASLRDLGRAFNVEHQKTEIDFSTMTYNRAMIEYNEQDCKCLYEVLERFFVETGVMSETFASQALRVWRKDFLEETLYKPSQEVEDLVRESYHGGRVEVFKSHALYLNGFDVNSMYPYVMQSPMPVKYSGESHQLLDTHFGFVNATVYIPEIYIPCLPVRLEKLFFPVGEVTATWTAEELIAGEQFGVTIQKIHKAYYFETRDIFKDFILKLYALKKDAGEPTRTIAKMLMNSFYGKFGQNPTKKVYCLERMAPDGAWPILLPDGTPSGFAYYERVSRAAYLLPHLSSAVTSKARLHLLSRLNNNVYYCDTDSVFTSETLETSKELGGWSDVGHGECRFIQPKLYQFNGQWKAKGLNREQSIDDFVAGNPNVIHRAKSIKEALKDGTSAAQHVHIEKLLRESRPKRAWDAQHEDTRPWNIKELKK